MFHGCYLLFSTCFAVRAAVVRVALADDDNGTVNLYLKADSRWLMATHQRARTQRGFRLGARSLQHISQHLTLSQRIASRRVHR